MACRAAVRVADFETDRRDPDERIKELEAQNEALRAQLDRYAKLLAEMGPSAGPSC